MKGSIRFLTSVIAAALLVLSVTTAEVASAQMLIDAAAESNLLRNGGFEADEPAYWDASGSGATWSSAHARTPNFSLALSGSGEASWSQDEAVRNWVGRIIGNQEIIVGGWVRTDGVNTNPSDDAGKFQLAFEFFNAAGTDLLGGPLVIDVPQSAASTDGWVRIDNTSIGALSLPENATSVKIRFQKGANATGTAYLDDVFVYNAGDGDWPGGWFNPNMDASDTWYYWWDGFDLGREDWPAGQPFIQTVTTEAAHTGSRSLKIEQNDPNASESVGISDRVPVTAGEPVLISFWVKTEDVPNPDSIGTADYNIGLTALWYSSLESGAAGYNEIGGLDIRLNGDYNPNVIPLVPREEETGWTQYAFVVYPKEDAVGMELRLRYWHHFEGTTYWDDVYIAHVSDLLADMPELNLLTNGSFEADKPAYWDASGSGATWSSAQARTPNYSLALSGSGEASWSQDEAVRNWVGRIIGNQEIIVGGWVRTDGVNTNPSDDAGKFQLAFEFFNAAGTDLLGGPLVIDVPQSAASTDGWVKIDNTSIGALSLPENATSVKIRFQKGANATGTAYLDDVFVYNAGDGDWPGGWFNPNMDASDTWYYWWDGFDLGREDWPAGQPFIQTVTTEAAHTGSRSLKIEQNDPNASESVGISDRVPVTAGEPVLISFRVKTEGVMHPDSIGTADYNIGLTALWYSSLESGAAGYNEIGGLDIRLNGDYNPNVIPLVPREEETGWTQYAFVVYPKDDAVGMELRLRYWHHFEGTTYWDDVAIANIGGSALISTAIEQDRAEEIPREFALHQNFPNPFNPSTTIAFDLTSIDNVTLEVYNVLGQRVASLISGREMTAGRHEVAFDGAHLSSGTYLYVLRTQQRTEARTMMLLK